MMDVELRAVFKGSVQGVGFRAIVLKYALELGLKGSVKNLPVGSVEVIAQGQKSAIEQLLRLLHEEPYPISISLIETEWRTIQLLFHTFKITH